MTAAVTEDVAGFLEDVLGRDAVLTPSCGRLREIHARISREVQATTNALHDTVTKEWSSLEKQLRTTLDLAERLQAVQSDVARVEGELDGSDSALKPRLVTSLQAHTDTVSRYTESKTLLDLLSSLRSAQTAVSLVKTCLDECQLDEAVRALLSVGRVLNNDIEDWKRDNEHYTHIQNDCKHLRNLLCERLEAAYDLCVVFGEKGIATCSLAIYQQATLGALSASRTGISFASVVASSSTLGVLHIQLERTAKQLLARLVTPLFENGNTEIVESEDSHTIELQPTSTVVPLSRKISSLTAILDQLRRGFTSSPEQLEILLKHIIPPIQSLLTIHVLVASVPTTASHDTLRQFQAVCDQVADLEQTHLRHGDTFEPTLQTWVDDAPLHWSQMLIQKAYETLRSEIASPEYWNKTETVIWEHDDEFETTKPLLLDGEGIVNEILSPKSPTRTVKSPNPVKSSLIPQSKKADIEHVISPKTPLNDAWGFDEEFDDDHDSDRGSVPSPQIGRSTISPPLQDDYGDEAEVGWDFEDDDTISIAALGNPLPGETPSSVSERLSTSAAKPGEQTNMSTLKLESHTVTNKPAFNGFAQQHTSSPDMAEGDGWGFDLDAEPSEQFGLSFSPPTSAVSMFLKPEKSEVRDSVAAPVGSMESVSQVSAAQVPPLPRPLPVPINSARDHAVELDNGRADVTVERESASSHSGQPISLKIVEAFHSGHDVDQGDQLVEASPATNFDRASSNLIPTGTNVALPPSPIIEEFDQNDEEQEQPSSQPAPPLLGPQTSSQPDKHDVRQPLAESTLALSADFGDHRVLPNALQSPDVPALPPDTDAFNSLILRNAGTAERGQLGSTDESADLSVATSSPLIDSSPSKVADVSVEEAGTSATPISEPFVQSNLSEPQREEVEIGVLADSPNAPRSESSHVADTEEVDLAPKQGTALDTSLDALQYSLDVSIAASIAKTEAGDVADADTSVGNEWDFENTSTGSIIGHLGQAANPPATVVASSGHSNGPPEDRLGEGASVAIRPDDTIVNNGSSALSLDVQPVHAITSQSTVLSGSVAPKGGRPAKDCTLNDGDVTEATEPATAQIKEEEDDWSAWDTPQVEVITPATLPLRAAPIIATSRSKSPTMPAQKSVRAGRLGAIRKADLNSTGDAGSRSLSLAAEPSQNGHHDAEPEREASAKPSGQNGLRALPDPPVIQVRNPESMLISVKARRVLDISNQLHTAAEAVAVEESKFSSRVPDLTSAYLGTFNLYRALMPVAHDALLASVPSLGMQYANDCAFLSRDAMRATRKRASDKALTSDQAKRAKLAFSSLANESDLIVNKQIELQRHNALECLSDASNFENTDEPSQFAITQRCVRQLVSVLQRVAQAWKSVLRPSMYTSSIGELVNHVLYIILLDIEDQEDISEEASRRLGELCTMLHELEDLFIVAGESRVALHVPVWFKFKFLSELLDASMADIMFLFNDGHLVDFSSEELTKLVRALFADSPLRERNLATINSGRH